MKIALISPHYGPPWNEGVRNLARCLVEYLQAKGEEIVVISPKLMPESRTLRPLLRVPFAQSTMFNLLAARWARQVAPDLVFSFASVSSALGIKSYLLRRTVGKPVVFYITGFRRSILGYRLFLNAERIIVNSDLLRGFFENAEVVPPFIDTSRFKGIKRENTVPSSKIILFLGAFEKCRGVEYLIRAMTYLHSRVEATLVLAWNGMGRNRYPHILREIKASRMEEKIKLLESADLEELYTSARVLVIPRISRERMVFPLRIMEAVTVGLPLIVTRTNMMDKTIDGCGLAVEPKDPKGLALAIEKLLTDNELYYECVNNCRKKAEEFNSERNMESIYRRLIDVSKGIL